MALPEVQVGRDPPALRPARRGGSSHNPGASRSPPGTLPSLPARVAGLQSGERARGLARGWDSPARRERDLRGWRRPDPLGSASGTIQVPSIILYNHLKQRYFLKSINYFQLFSDDPTFFFSLQLHVGDFFTSGKS